MTDKKLDEILKQATQPEPVDPKLLDRIANSLGQTLKPVRPLPPTWVLATGIALICIAVALAGAVLSNFHGLEKLDTLQRAVLFPALAVLIGLAASRCVAEFIPGSRRRIPAGGLMTGASLALLASFAFLFRDYQTDRFVSQGMVCLMVGLFYALLASAASWLILRRCWAVSPATAGLSLGTLASLAGVSMLELHCPNFQALHVIFWHTAVIPVGAAIGSVLATLFRPTR